MSRDPSQEGRGFLSRWSQRKQHSREDTPPERELAEAAAQGQELPDADDGAAAGPGELTEEQIAALPDPDTLGPGDDFKPFLQRGVPEMLKRRALRRLWSVNPLFNFRDGLNEYDEDYTDAATVVANLKTLFQPGKGMPQPERWRKPEPPAEQQAASDLEDAGETAGRKPEAVEGQDTAEEKGAADDRPDPSLAAGPDSGRQAIAPAVPPERSRRPAAQRRWSAFVVDEDEGGDVPVER